MAEQVARCNLCPPDKAFKVPAPLDFIGVALMKAHLAEEHPQSGGRSE